MVLRVCIWNLLDRASIYLSDGTFIGLKPTTAGVTSEGKPSDDPEKVAKTETPGGTDEYGTNTPDQPAPAKTAVEGQGSHEGDITKPGQKATTPTAGEVEVQGSRDGSNTKPDQPPSTADIAPVVEGKSGHEVRDAKPEQKVSTPTAPVVKVQGSTGATAQAVEPTVSSVEGTESQPGEPDITINMHELNEEAIRKWWDSEDKDKRGMNEFVVYDALVKGGALTYLTWYQRKMHNKPSSPGEIEQFCRKVKKGAPARNTDLGLWKK